MARLAFPLLFVLIACSSGSSGTNGSTPSSDDGGACPNVAGSWTIQSHCDTSLVGQSVVISQSGCTLAFAAPFNGFSGTVTSDDRITLTGPQTCSGTVTSKSVAMACTPGTCNVALGR